ncbi:MULTISPECIES: c-type cytochrome [Alteromonadaceae]|uniref:c-type cytochrome n=1 Tax=Alteromonadaceae TaxID=72275 RepID=UPI001C08BC5C|nr:MULTISPECIES: c-type cytochrome [unclassified Aliiglaciecola]MBU2879073.1 c-type cytochrome [Aliiglaciecola lipolytica]MDO6710771.1 c-type cytochrome [Aliiglaciecola sp. 2_MG-2023]MDO6751821.1 c-type cytochrome [Aliiglaciecola sp. 1_MG-2023]
MKLKALLSVLVGSLLMFAVQAQNMSEEDIKSRIAPVGSVHVAGAKADSAAASGPRSGEDIYNTACFACHASGVLNAPKLHDAADWSPRLEKGIDEVLHNALNGLGSMPPRGTCGDCSDDDIKAAIEFMIEGV